MARLQGIQRAVCRGPSTYLFKLEEKLQNDYEILLEQEHLFWKQKSRIEWLQGGDRNTKFFHLTTLVRRRRNRIERLKDENGNWVFHQDELRNLAVNYFTNLFDSSHFVQVSYSLPCLFPEVDVHAMEEITAAVTGEEIKAALFAIGPLKAPGPDGFPAIFFQKCWGICKDDVISFIMDIFNTGLIPGNLNDTLITLVPKTPQPESMLQMRPISLCNTLYKVISKIIVNRLRPLMCKVVSPNQVSFVPGRQITDNIFIAQEVLHRYRRAEGHMGYIAWKIDLSKAYDRLRWNFIEQVLVEIGLGGIFLQLIMHCVRSVNYKVVLNGELSNSFTPHQGIRQGDPLSPYLFVLCMEKLSHIISEKVINKQWRAVKAGRSGPLISHLFFADDLILFGEATISQATLMKNCLDNFCEISGQRVNFDKSAIFCSPNTPHDIANDISRLCGSPLTDKLGNYLGVPLIQERVTGDTYKDVIDKVQAKLTSWKSQILSLAGRLTVIQAVTSAIPTYVMQTAKLPASVCNQLDKINRNFLWGDTTAHAKVHLVNWDYVCRPKRCGGLGIKKSAHMNQALLAKASWRITNRDEGLWAEMMRKKYLGGSSNFSSYNEAPSYASSTWKSIICGAETLQKGLKWRLGDGRNVRFWTDRWIGTKSLLDLGLVNVDNVDSSEYVADYLIEGQWNMDKLHSSLPNEAIQKIINIPLGVESGLHDACIWGLSSNGNFSVKSAYSLCCRPDDHTESKWNFIWKINIPPRIKTFLWLLTQGKILTNEQRKRRKLCDNAACSLCSHSLESLHHVFLGCPKAKLIWNIVSIPQCIKGYFDYNFEDWLLSNLRSKYEFCNSMLWQGIFACTCWFIWKWRCSAIFDPHFRSPFNPRLVIQRSLEDWCNTNKIPNSRPLRDQVLLKWAPPPCDVLKLNIDGSRLSQNGCIAAGGLIRNSEGDWVCGFSANLGVGEIFVAELWALCIGLKMALGHNATHLMVESDSALVVKMVKGEWDDTHPLHGIITVCKALWLRSWNCTITHIYRECNMSADGLAQLGHTLSLGQHFFEEPPDCIKRRLQEDKEGLLRPRLVIA